MYIFSNKVVWTKHFLQTFDLAILLNFWSHAQNSSETVQMDATLETKNVATLFLSNPMDSKIIQKQPSRGVLKKRRSENMQQIYRRTPMPKYDFNKVAKQLYWTLLKSHFGMSVLR